MLFMWNKEVSSYLSTDNIKLCITFSIAFYADSLNCAWEVSGYTVDLEHHTQTKPDLDSGKVGWYREAKQKQCSQHV